MNKTLSNRIRELRKMNGFTQLELANLLNVGQTTVANYEKGIRLPDAAMLNKIASLFGVTMDFLIGRTGTKETSSKEIMKEDAAYELAEETYKIYIEHFLRGETNKAVYLIVQLYEKGADLRTIYFDVLEKGLHQVGLLWEKGMIDVWQEHLISEITIDLMRMLKNQVDSDSGKEYTMITLSAGAELHSIGIRMLGDILELEGWNVLFLGVNVPVQSLIKAIESEKPDVVAISVTMQYHIESAKNTIAAIRHHLQKKAPLIIVGGKAFLDCQDVCELTGADYYGETAEDIKSMILNRIS